MREKKLILLYIFILLGPIIDLLTSLTLRLTDINLTVGLILRGAFFLVLFIYLFFFNKSRFKKVSRIYVIISALFVIAFLLKRSIMYDEISYLFKYMYFPIILLSLLCLNDEKKLNDGMFVKIFQVNTIVICALLLISYVTGTYFSSYKYDGTGCIGWFYSANEIGAILAMIFPYILYFIKRYKTYKVLLLILPIVFVMCIIGTKTALLSIFFSSIIFGVYFLIKMKKYTIKPFISMLIVIAFIFVLSPTLSVTNNLKNSLDIEEGPKSMLSDRDEFHQNNKKLFKNASTYEIVLGMGFSDIRSGELRLIEMDPLDVFYKCGIIGFIIYFTPIFIILFLILKYVFKSRFRLTFDMLIYGFTAGIGLCVSLLAGHVMSAPGVSIYLSIILTMLISDMYYQNKLENNKITIYALSLGFGGVEKYIASLCKMLSNDYNVEIVSTYKISAKPAFEIPENVKIIYLINRGPNRQEVKECLKKFQIFKLIKECFIAASILFKRYVYNMVNISDNNSKFLITTRFHSYLVGEYATKESIKIATEHNYHNDDKKYINKIISSLMHFDYFVVVSEDLEKFYKNKIGKTKCIYIQNVIDELPKCESKLESKNIINVGRFVCEKGLFDLIDVYKLVHDKISDSKLYLIGDGYLKKDLINYTRSLNLEDNIIFTGFLRVEELENYYLNSSLYVMTSFTESFGLSLIESSSYKVPAIAFDSASGAREILKDTGLLIKNRDKHLMAEKIIELLNKKDKLSRLSVKSYENVQKYLLNNAKIKWIELLKNL